MRKNRALLVIAAATLIVGIMLAVQFQANRRGPTYVSQDHWANLTKQIDQLRRQNVALSNEVVSLRAQLADSNADRTMSELGKELDRYSRLAGLTPVRGPGIILILDDGKDPLRMGDGLVHDSTLRTAVNELNLAGATAISINGERFISTTEIRCAGPIILMNIHRIAAPFEIRAIGNPRRMEDQINLPDGAMSLHRYLGVRIKVDRRNRIEIPPFNGTIPSQFAKPVPGSTSRAETSQTRS